ncbi:MAG TPA: TolC family protein [Polyangiales bacterium]|nr:TolC family protein [Polyangiales bacterium]
MRIISWLAVVISACAPSLSSQVSTVGSLARVEGLPELQEGKINPSSGQGVATLLQQPLDADAAVRVALLNNRELRARLRELGVPAGDLVSAGLVANPTVEFELLPERDSQYELRVEYDLTSLLMAPLRRGAAADELEAARLTVAGDVIQLGYDVRTRFYAVQAAQQRLELAQKSLEALAAARDAAQALVDAGNIRQLDAASQIAAYERSRVEVAMLELELAERREDMQRLLGLHGEQTGWQIQRVLQDAPDELAADDLESAAIGANLDLRAAHKRLEGLSKQSGIARTEGWVPEVLADVHALRVERDSGEGSGEEWRWGAGVALEVPLFDRGQGRLQGIESRFDATSERYQGLAVEVRSAARDARNRLASSHARARQYRNVILPAQRVVLEQTVLQYNAMQLGVFELLAARRELLDVELAYVDTLRDYWSSRAEVEALTRGRIVRAADTAQSARLSAATTQAGGH